MKRGDVCWANLEPRSRSEQRGRRPVVIVSSDGFNAVPTWRSVIVVPITTSPRQARRGPTVVAIPALGSGLTASSVAVCHQISTLDRAKIDDRISTLPQSTMAEIEQAILAACDIAPSLTTR